MITFKKFGISVEFMDTIEKISNKLGFLYGLFFILVAWAFFAGGILFVKSHADNLFFISLGFLTFISIFFGFIYYQKGEQLKKEWESDSKSFEAKIRKEISKIVLEGKNSEKIQKSLDRLSDLENIYKNTDPEKWLLVSTFCWFLIPLLSLFSNSSTIPYLNINLITIIAIVFHFAIFFSSCLLVSILTWIVSSRLRE